jgi:hypothetical protein
VVLHRRHRDTVHPRLVGQGGAVTTLALPLPGGSGRALRAHAALAHRLGALQPHERTAAARAERCTAAGARSPRQAPPLWPRTVRGMRRQPQRLGTRRPSPPRQSLGALTVPHLARGLGVSPPGRSARLATGTMQILRDPPTGLSLCPDPADPREPCQPWKDGRLHARGCLATTTQPGVSAGSPDHASAGLAEPSRGWPSRGRPRVLDRSSKMPDRNIAPSRYPRRRWSLGRCRLGLGRPPGGQNVPAERQSCPQQTWGPNATEALAAWLAG